MSLPVIGISDSYRVFEVQLPTPRRRIPIGSSSQCDLRINDISISRCHAFIVLEDGTYRVSDNNSAMGTTANGELLGPNEIREIASISAVLGFCFAIPDFGFTVSSI